MAMSHMTACRAHDDVLKALCSLSTFVGAASVAIGLAMYGHDAEPARVIGGGIDGVFPFVESFPRQDESVLLFVGPMEYDCILHCCVHGHLIMPGYIC